MKLLIFAAILTVFVISNVERAECVSTGGHLVWMKKEANEANKLNRVLMNDVDSKTKRFSVSLTDAALNLINDEVSLSRICIQGVPLIEFLRRF